MLVSGTNIADGTTVQSLSGASPPTVTIKPAALGDVPNASLITFTTPVPPNTIPSTLADQIIAWLPAKATVATLIKVTAAQWTKFFTDNPRGCPRSRSRSPSIVPNPTLPAGFSLPDPVSLSFCVMEALYARGFRSAKDITALSADDFQQALIGTVACGHANTATNSLYQAAQKIAPSSPPAGHNGKTFHPVNPDRALPNTRSPRVLAKTSVSAHL
jgi:hypothetical protein